MVNFIVSFICSDVQLNIISGCVCEDVSRISIRVTRQSKEDCLSQSRHHHSTHWGPEQNKKEQERRSWMKGDGGREENVAVLSFWVLGWDSDPLLPSALLVLRIYTISCLALRYKTLFHLPLAQHKKSHCTVQPSLDRAAPCVIHNLMTPKQGRLSWSNWFGDRRIFNYFLNDDIPFHYLRTF